MNINTAEVQQRAIQKLQSGSDKYKNANDDQSRKDAYNEFVDGIDLLVKLQRYMKDNRNASEILTRKIKEYVARAKQMKSEMQSGNFSNSGGGGGEGGNSGGNSNNNSGVNNSKGPKDDENAKFKDALSAAIVTEKPDVKWEDVAGLETAKKTLQEAIILPVKFPDIFVGIRKPWKGILLYGPPGTGKTYLAKACATQADATFFSISSSDLISKWVGESEKLIKALFQLAKENEPSIIFIDEIDSMVSARSEGQDEASGRVKTEFLVQMQGVGSKEGKILVLGATNFPWGLDPAMRRRFQKRIYIPLPDYEARLYMLRKKMEKQQHLMQEHEFQDLANRLDGFSGSDIAVFIKQASFEPLRKTREATHFKQLPDGNWVACASTDPGARPMKMDQIDGSKLVPPPLQYHDFIRAFAKAKPSVGPEDLVKHQQFTNDFGMEA